MIVIYSKDNCPFCEKAKKICEQQGWEFAENKIGRDVQIDEFKELFPQARTVPQIIKIEKEGTRLIGGCDDLEKYVVNQELGELDQWTAI